MDDAPRTGATRRAAPWSFARRPKQLDEEPTLFLAGRGGGGAVLRAAPRSRRGGAVGPGSTEPATTDEDAELQEIALEADVDPRVVDRAREIAATLTMPRTRGAAERQVGPGSPASVRWRGGGAEIDLDATVAALVANPVAADEDVIVREPRRTRRSVVLAVDVSGSMRGERVRTAAATVAALASLLADDRLAVIAFWSDAALLAPLGPPPPAWAILDTLLRVPARGLTNVSFPLALAGRQLASVPAREGRVLLLSDCVHNAGPDPRVAAARLGRLDVLVDSSGEHDLGLARELARVGRGGLATAHRHEAVAPALGGLLPTG